MTNWYGLCDNTPSMAIKPQHPCMYRSRFRHYTVIFFLFISFQDEPSETVTLDRLDKYQEKGETNLALERNIWRINANAVSLVNALPPPIDIDWLCSKIMVYLSEELFISSSLQSWFTNDAKSLCEFYFCTRIFCFHATRLLREKEFSVVLYTLKYGFYNIVFIENDVARVATYLFFLTLIPHFQRHIFNF